MIQTGDFLLYPVGPESGWLARLIAWGQRAIGQAPTKRAYSHVAIVGPDLLHQYEAWWPRIRITSIRLDSTEVYRIHGIAPQEVSMMMWYLSLQVGRLYDMIALITMGKVQIGGADVCSQLAYKAAESAGYVLYPPESFESPDDIAASPLLVRVQ